MPSRQPKDARDQIAIRLDVEQEKLDALEQAYSDIKDLIQEMESALDGFASAMKSVLEDAEELSRLEELFAAGEGVDFEDMGGTGGVLGREGGLADIEAMNAALQEEIEKALAGMDHLDILGAMQDQIDKLKDLDFLAPMKAAWTKVETWLAGIGNWIKDHLWIALTAAFYFVGGAVVFLYYGLFKVITEYVPVIAGWVNEHIIQPVWQAIQAGWDVIVGIWNWVFENLLQPVIDFGIKIYNLLYPPIKAAWDLIVAAFQWAWGIIEPILSWLWDKIDGYIIPIIELFWVSAQIAFKLIVLALQWLWDHVDEIFGFIWSIITNVVIPVFEWLWERAGEVFTLLGAIIETVWRTYIEPIFNLIKWALENIVVPAFRVAKAVIEEIWNGIAIALQWVWDHLLSPIWAAFQIAFDTIIKPAFEFLRDKIIKPIMDTIYNVIKGVWNTIAGVIEGGVKFFIRAFNAIAKGVNVVAKFLTM